MLDKGHNHRTYQEEHEQRRPTTGRRRRRIARQRHRRLGLCPLSFLLLLILLLVATSVVVVSGFSAESPPSAFQTVKGSRRMSSDTTTSNKDERQQQQRPFHWRIIDKKKEEDEISSSQNHGQILQERPIWSNAAYEQSLQLYEQLSKCCDDDYISSHIHKALTCLDHALRLYGPQNVLCSFNGGKDAVVILQLHRAALAHYYHYSRNEEEGKAGSQNQNQLYCPRVIYFDHKDEFPEVQDFLKESVQDLELDMIAFAEGTKFPEGLQILVDNNCMKQAKDSRIVQLPMAFVLGTRWTDPNAIGQTQFAPSSHYMPPFMRVNPVLDWNYGHVWHFLRLFQLPYCNLYDRGYTSLGTTRDTIPCPDLAIAGQPSNVPKYWPAYMLRDYDKERAGRIVNAKKHHNNKSDKKAAAAAAAAKDDTERSDYTNTSTAAPPSVSSIGHLSTLSEGRRVVMVAETNHTNHDKDKNEQDASLSVSADDDDTASIVSYNTVSQKTAAILIIGDEILKGYTNDTNTNAAATALREQNVVLKTVSVVSDCLDDIVQEIRRLRNMVDVVITSGGVGPTHDDVTMKSVAEALGCGMELHTEMANLLKEKMNNKNDDDTDSNADDDGLTDAQVKMATLPKFSKLRYLSQTPNAWPVLQCKNIFILPGIPEFFAKKIRNVAEYLSCQLERSLAYKVVLQIDENSIVSVLNQVVEKHPLVSIGSYPFVSHPEFKTVITLEAKLVTTTMDNNNTSNGGSVNLDRAMRSRNSHVLSRDELLDWNNYDNVDAKVQMALDDLMQMLPSGSVLRVDNEDMRLFT